MKQMLRAWRVQLYLDLLFLTRDRRNSIVYMTADLILTIASITGVLLLAERFNGIGEWSRPQVIFMLGFASLAVILCEGCFGMNVLWISRRIGRGQLDHLLIQPRPIWMALLTEGFIPISYAPPLIPGVALTAWSVSALRLETGIGWWAAFALNLLASMAVITAFSYMWGSLAFWAPAGAEEISSSAIRLIGELKPFPLDGLGRGLTAGLLSVIPAGFVAWYPAGALLGIRNSQYGLLVTPLAALVMCVAAALVFNRGLAHYARTGSQRYLDFGHRR